MSNSVVFAQNYSFFTRKNGTNLYYMKMNFDYFQIEKWMLEVEQKKQMKKWGHLFSFHVSFPSYGTWTIQKSPFFAILSWHQQETWICWSKFTYIHLKVFVTPIQKMIWFIEVWATIYELLVIKSSKEMLTQKIFIIDFIHQLQTLISLRQQVVA